MIVAAPGVGEEVGPYLLEEQLGEGGMGVVYRATHRVLRKKAAVKLMRARLCADEESVKRFFNEAVLTAAIRHPGIVEIFDYGVHDSGSAYIAMALLDGESLETRLKAQGSLPLLDALRISRQIAGALAAAHDAGVVHRDLKPDNVFLTTDSDVPGGERTQLLDFGIAKLLGDEEEGTSLTRTGTVLGTPLYMSPEQCRGKSNLDGRTDLYALGCMLYQMLAGRPPFTGDSALEVGAAHVRDEPEPLASLCGGLAPEVCALVHALLAKKKEERPASAKLVADRLGALISVIETSPLSGRHRFTTTPLPVGVSAEFLELAETIGATGDEGSAIAPIGSRWRGGWRLLGLGGVGVIVAGSLALALGLRPSDKEQLTSSLVSSEGCPAAPATCRAFADLVRSGDGVRVDLPYARALVRDACAKGSTRACIDEIAADRRASITHSRAPVLGPREAPVDVVLALDYTQDDTNEWVQRFSDLERRFYGEVKVTVAPLRSNATAVALADVGCLLTKASSFASFLTLRPALVEGGISRSPPPRDLAMLGGGDPQFAEAYAEECEVEKIEQGDALARHRVNLAGTAFVAGRRLDPPYSDEALDALVREAQVTVAERVTRTASQIRLPSSRHRVSLRPTAVADQPVSVVTFCDPALATCDIALSFHKHFPDAFGAAVQTEMRPIVSVEDPSRTVAACVLEKVGGIARLEELQLKRGPDRALRVLSAAEILAVAGEFSNAPEIEHYNGSVCPEQIRLAQEELRAATGKLEPLTFVNGRPCPIGALSELRALIDEELLIAEKLAVGVAISYEEARALLVSYDNDPPFGRRR